MEIKATSFVKNTIPVGTIFYHISSVPPEGAFLLNGQIIYNCSTLYPEFYQYVTNNNGIRKITSSAYESELSSIGICGGFVVDSENGSIRLPNISNGFIEGSNGNNVGNVLDAGLPNITGRVDNIMTSYNSAIEDNGLGSLSLTAYSATGPTQDSNKQICRLFINASKSSSVYGKSNTVQPKSVCYSICIQVFNAVTSLSNQISAQLVSEMQSKAGINADNFTASGKSKIIDNTFELDWENTIDVPAIETYYQAAKNGILVARGYDGSLFVYSAPEAYDNAGSYPIIGNNCYAVNQALVASCLVTKGDYYIVQSTCSQLYEKKFIPFKNSIADS